MATLTSLESRDIRNISPGVDHKDADTTVTEDLLFEFGENTPTDISIIKTVASGCAASMLQGPELSKDIRANREALRPIARKAWDLKKFRTIRDIGVFPWAKPPNPVFI